VASAILTKGVEMPRERFTIRSLGALALIVAALGFGVLVGAPNVAVAQEDTTTTTVAGDDSPTTIDGSTDGSEDADRSAATDHDCGDRSGSSTSEDTTQSDA
jgi:hypothetical protein